MTATNPRSTPAPTRAVAAWRQRLSSLDAWLRRHPIWTTAIVAGIALLLRLVFIAQTHALAEYVEAPTRMDMQLNLEAARELRGVAGGDAAFAWRTVSAPLYPLLLAAQQALFGDHVTLQRVVTAILACLRWLPLMWVLRQLSARAWPAIVGGLLLALSRPAIYYDTTLMKTHLDLTLLVVLVALVVLADRRSSWRQLLGPSLAAGITLALAGLSQMQTILLVGPYLAFGLLRAGWTWRARAAVCVPALAIALGTAMVWHAAQLDSSRNLPVPRAGFELRLGFWDGAKTVYDNPLVPQYPFGHAFFSRMLAELEARRPMTFSEADAWHRHAALAWIAAHPGRAVELGLARARIFLGAYEPRGDVSIDMVTDQSSLIATLPVRFTWFTVLAVFGLAALARRDRRGLLAFLFGAVLTIGAASCLTFVTDRFRLPAVVPLVVLAAVGLDWLVNGGWRRWRFMLPATALAIVLAVVGALPPPGVSPALALEYARMSVRQSEAALAWRAQLAQPEAPGADPFERVSLYLSLGEDTRAFARIAALVRAGSHDEQVQRYDLLYLMWLGRYDQAAQAFGALRTRDPEVAAAVLADLQTPRTVIDEGQLAPIFTLFVLPRLEGHLVDPRFVAPPVTSVVPAP